MLCAVLLGIFVSSSPYLEAETPRKIFRPDQVKAVFVVNFCRFVKWPEHAFADPTAPLVIGVWGDDAFAELVQEAALGEHIGQRAMEVRRIETAADIDRIQLLFIAANAEKRFEQSHHEDQKEILLVGDSPTFLRSGGHIQFVSEAGRIKLRVNLQALTNHNIVVSSSLLRISEIASAP